MRVSPSLLLAVLLMAPIDGSAVLESAYSSSEVALDPDPGSEAWKDAPRVVADHDKFGEPIPGPATEIRSRWTTEHLYLLYVCPYDDLNLKPDPNVTRETPRLWNWDVAEAFIGSDFDQIARYKEFQVSPQGEWVDLDIDRADPKRQGGMAWSSGYLVKARIDARAKIWYGLMRIPFRALDTRPPEKGRELRIGLYRIAGVEPARRYFAWRPTGQITFHVPQAFGTLRLR
ncbi:MAG: carbohydrate-binding family 9-like protein [Vicinamibacterales bacterium]